MTPKQAAKMMIKRVSRDRVISIINEYDLIYKICNRWSYYPVQTIESLYYEIKCPTGLRFSVVWAHCWYKRYGLKDVGIFNDEVVVLKKREFEYITLKQFMIERELEELSKEEFKVKSNKTLINKLYAEIKKCQRLQIQAN